jgi:hypothetical protein
MLVGLEYVARVINFYTAFELVYLNKSSKTRDQLAASLLKTYTKLLGFLPEAKGYYGEHTFKARVQGHLQRWRGG